MKKRIFGIIFVLCAALLVSSVTALADPIEIYMGGEALELDVSPIIVEGRTMLPVRAVFENIGAKVSWDGDTRTVTATKGDTTVQLTIDSTEMLINGTPHTLDVPAMIKESRTLVPLRACAEAFGLDVSWYEKYRAVRIKQPVYVVTHIDYSDGSYAKREYDQDGNLLRVEDSDGYVETYGRYDELGVYNEYHSFENGAEVYGFWQTVSEDGREVIWENTDHETEKRQYDENHNLIYSEDHDGYWTKRQYDQNQNCIYYEDSDGYWEKRTYDEQGLEIRYEDSDGYRSEEHYDAYGHYLGVDRSDGSWSKHDYNELGQETRWEDSDGYWVNYTYDDNGNEIYFEDSDGDWVKREFDGTGNTTYREDSDGSWWKSEYDQNGNEVYWEDSDGYWVKSTYDENGNEVYWEDSDGDWARYTYDENGNTVESQYADGSWMKYQYQLFIK